MREFGVFFKVKTNLHLPDSEIKRLMKVAEDILNSNMVGHNFTFMDFRKKPSK